MTKLRILLSSLLFVLVGCGGGGSTQPEVTPVTPKPVSQFETPVVISTDKFRLAKIDYRYDTVKTQVDINGNHTTSFESVKSTIDNIKQIGFTGIILLLQTPVDKNKQRFDEIHQIACEHQVDSYMASLLYHSKI